MEAVIFSTSDKVIIKNDKYDSLNSLMNATCLVLDSNSVKFTKSNDHTISIHNGFKLATAHSSIALIRSPRANIINSGELVISKLPEGYEISSEINFINGLHIPILLFLATLWSLFSSQLSLAWYINILISVIPLGIGLLIMNLIGMSTIGYILAPLSKK